MYLKSFKPNKYVKCLEDFQCGDRFFRFCKDSIYELRLDIDENRLYVSPREYFLVEFCLVEDKFTIIN